MKKLLLIACGIIILASCVEKSNVKTEYTNYKIGPYGYDLKVINLEGCEYYFVPLTGSYNLCHKGNCKNHIHYKNK
jgi:hypothetical protein